MKQLPFTAYIHIGQISGKRFEQIRDLQKTASIIYDELISDADLTIATPGGGQHRFGAGLGTAVKPRIGLNLAQLTVTGYYAVNEKNFIPQPLRPMIHDGEFSEGYNGANAWVNNPTSSTDGYVSSLKTKIETALTNAGADPDWEVHKIEILGVIYGTNGHHFPL